LSNRGWQTERGTRSRLVPLEQLDDIRNASGLSFLSNAVLVWNSMAIMKIIIELRAAGETILDEDLTQISPLMHQHVIPNGTYHFARYKPGDDIA
jgi:hypothetical protein